MQIITTIIIAISLSMDAFSLSIAYGTLNLRKKEIYILSLIVGNFFNYIFYFILMLLSLFYFFVFKFIKLNS